MLIGLRVVPLLFVCAACGASSVSAAPVVPSPAPAASPAAPERKSVVIDHEVKTLAGESVKLSSYRGKALLIVNTASACGYTPQYAGLQELFQTYGERGLVVLGFPSNDFGAQEPGSSQEIREFCDRRFRVTFPMFEKVHARGAEKAPLYRALTEETGPGVSGEVRWNFTKFLVDPKGEVVARFEPGVDPLSAELRTAIERVLPK